MALDAGTESTLWADCLLPEGERDREPVFSPLGEQRYALGLETIYEGYLVHYGRPRLFAPPDDDTALLLGDYLYAHGVERISALHDVEAVADLSELISLCSQLRAEDADQAASAAGRAGGARPGGQSAFGAPRDGPLWAATAALLGRGVLDEARTPLRLRADPSRLDAAAREAAGDGAVEAALAAHARRREVPPPVER
jgi:hypothetical protein